jgi:hypothetical protein
MSDILVTSKECLVICVDEPERIGKRIGRADGPIPSWYGVLECKSQDWSIDQIAAHMGKPEYVVRILKISEYGVITNITDEILTWAEDNA